MFGPIPADGHAAAGSVDGPDAGQLAARASARRRSATKLKRCHTNLKCTGSLLLAAPLVYKGVCKTTNEHAQVQNAARHGVAATNEFITAAARHGR